MKIYLRLLLCGFSCLLVLAACSSFGRKAVPTVINVTSPPKATQVLIVPTSISPGAAIIYKDLRVVMSQAHTTNGYLTEFGSNREPGAGIKFLWVEVLLENIGPTEQALPALEHFSAVYGSNEFKPAYGHRQDHPDYSNLKPVLYQGQKVSGWLRFDVPAAAGLQDLQFAFLPESLQVGSTSRSTEYSWADHPIYFWQCGQ